jgi:hypothetical protein
MELAFKVSFVLATAVELALFAVLAVQLWRRRRHGRIRLPVLTSNDALVGAALFGGTMTVTAILADGWADAWSKDTLLYAVTFGIVTSGLVAFLRRREEGRAALVPAAFLMPVAFGVLGGLSGL